MMTNSLFARIENFCKQYNYSSTESRNQIHNEEYEICGRLAYFAPNANLCAVRAENDGTISITVLNEETIDTPFHAEVAFNGAVWGGRFVHEEALSKKEKETVQFIIDSLLSELSKAA